MLFVDLVGSTRLAAERSPTEALSLLNAFFGVVVEVVDRHDGWVNKFAGDAALAVFGVPVEHPTAAADTLAAARELAAGLSREGPDLAVGIGVSSAIAGDIGGERRFGTR